MSSYYKIILVLVLAGCLSSTQGLGQNNAGRGNESTTPPKSTNAADSDATQDILGMLTVNPRFKTLIAAINQTSVRALLSNSGPYTFFAATNDAFNALPKGTMDNWMKDKSKETLASILKFHIVPGRMSLMDLNDGQKLKTVNGEELSVTKLNNKIAVNGVEIVEPDLDASNGIIHVIGQVLVPSSQEAVGNKKQ